MGWRSNGVIRYAPEADNNILDEFVPGVIERHTYEYLNPDTQRRNHKKFPDISNRAQIAAELAYKFAGLGPVLVFCSQTNFVQAVANALYERLDLAKRAGMPIPSYFSGIMETRSSVISREWMGDRPLANWLKYGVGVHYGGLPEVLRKSVEADFRGRGLRVLIATNTLAQGVNLPVKTVIIHSCRRYMDESHPYERIPARDYWNIAGRAGRAGEETEGLIIHITTGAQDKGDFEHYKRLRDNVEPVESALYQILKSLAEDRISEEALENKLDPEILALLVEECPDSFNCDISDLFEDILNRSLVRVQADRHSRPIQPLKRAFINIAENITKRIPNQEFLGIFSSKGLSTISCELIYNHICANKPYLKGLLTNRAPEHRDDLIEIVLPICMSLSEMKPAHDFGGSYTDLLRQWMRGIELQDLLAQYRTQSISLEDLGRFIDDLFGYRLPWGFSAYLRIAIHVLEISKDNLSDTAKFLPSMIKFGLPSSVACWVMSLGIPYRKVAISISSKFLDEVALPYSYEGFLEWLGRLNGERLKYDLNLKNPFLEDISRIIFTASSNPLLRQLTNVDDLLPFEIEIKGIQYENRRIAVSNASAGLEVALFRDYDNIVDRNAIGIKLLDDELGYVPREIAQILAPEMDTGRRFKATISRIDKELPTPKVLVLIESFASAK
jgi:helicase